MGAGVQDGGTSTRHSPESATAQKFHGTLSSPGEGKVPGRDWDRRPFMDHRLTGTDFEVSSPFFFFFLLESLLFDVSR